MDRLNDFLEGKIEFSSKVEGEIIGLLEDLDFLKSLKDRVRDKLIASGFVQSEGLKLTKSTIKKVKLDKALKLSRDEFDKTFDITNVKARTGVQLDDEWYNLSPRVVLRRKKK